MYSLSKNITFRTILDEECPGLVINPNANDVNCNFGNSQLIYAELSRSANAVFCSNK